MLNTTLRHFAVISALAATAALSACANTPTLIDQNEAGGPPVAAKSILIFVDGRVFDAPLFGTQGRAFLTGLGDGLQGALAGVPTRVVQIDPMQLDNPVPSAFKSAQPTQTIRVATISDRQRNGTPVSAVWQMTVSNVKTTTVAAADGKPARETFQMTPVYKLRAEGDVCLVSDNGAHECGESMGKFLGSTLRAAHAIQLDPAM
jgi:hypothetical protein